MKSVLAITHLEEDEQLDLVRSIVEGMGVEFFTLCTNSRKNLGFALNVKDSAVEMSMNGRTFTPGVIWYATHPRTDSLYCHDFQFPGEHRSAMFQYISDLDYMYRDKLVSMPCNLDLVGRADSKPFLLSEAARCGLTTPTSTMNCTSKTKLAITSQKMYKKKLGFPTVITFDKKGGTEVISTTVNKIGNSNAGKEVWQWQSPVESSAHVRCCIVGGKIWSVIWGRKSTIGKLYDYRSQELVDEWKPYNLPQDVETALLSLVQVLGLKMACPEFLVQKNGQHVFIDMNPCGDWAGFFEDSVNSEIASSLAELLTSSL